MHVSTKKFNIEFKYLYKLMVLTPQSLSNNRGVLGVRANDT